MGAASGAAIGAAAGGGPGAALGAAIGGATGIFGGSLLPLHRHRAPITVTRPMGVATQATDIPPIGILLTDIPVMDSRGTDSQAIRDTALIRVPQAMDTQTVQDIPPTPVLRAMDTQVTQGILIIWVPERSEQRSSRLRYLE